MQIPGELIPIVLFVCAAAVAILAPISSKLGKLLEAMALERQRPNADAPELARMRTLVEHLTQRVDLIDERLAFTERLVDNSRPMIRSANEDTAHATPEVIPAPHRTLNPRS